MLLHMVVAVGPQPLFSLAVAWRPVSGPSHVDLSVGQLTRPQLSSSEQARRARESKQMEVTGFYNLISEVTFATSVVLYLLEEGYLVQPTLTTRKQRSLGVTLDVCLVRHPTYCQ